MKNYFTMDLFVFLFKWGICLVLLSSFSPAFYYLSGKWGLMKQSDRLISLLVSPMFIIMYIVGFVSLQKLYYNFFS